MSLSYEEGKIVTADGVSGTFTRVPLLDGMNEPSVRVIFKDTLPVVVPISLLVHKRGKTFEIPLRLRQVLEAKNIAAVIPVVSEELRVDKQEVVTGGVRISKRVRRKTEVVDEPLFKEEIEIERVPVNRYIENPAGIRVEGDTTFIPLYEEMLVVQKRLLLREELAVRKKRVEFHTPQKITRRREDVVVEDLKATLRKKDGAVRK